MLLSGGVECCPLPLCANSLFRKREEEKITDQRHTSSLTSSSCLSTFRTSCVFSSEKRNKKNILISWQRNSASWQQPNSPATGEEGGTKERLGENNTRGYIWRYIYTFSLRDEPTFDASYLLASMRPLLVSVEERWDTSCQLKGKGGVSFAHLPEVWIPLKVTNMPFCSSPHGCSSTLPIETHYDLWEARKLQYIPWLFKAATLPSNFCICMMVFVLKLALCHESESGPVSNKADNTQHSIVFYNNNCSLLFLHYFL